MPLRGLTINAQGQLLRDGTRFRNIGINWPTAVWDIYGAALPGQTYYTSSDDQDQVIATLVSMKCKVVIFSPFPFYPAHWTLAVNNGVSALSATAADREPYYQKIDALLDKLAANDIGAIFRMFHRHATIPDLVGQESRAGWLNAGSTRTVATAITQEIVTRYLNHSAVYGYQHGTETNHRNDISQTDFANDSWPAVNASLGTGAPGSYTAANSAFFGSEWQQVLEWWYGVIRAIDPNRIVLSGNGPNSYSQPGGVKGISSPMRAWHLEQVRDNPTNCGQIHWYGNVGYGSNNFRGLNAILTGVRHWQRVNGRAFMLGEFGSQPWRTTAISGDGSTATFTCAISVPLEPGDPFLMGGTGSIFDGTYTVDSINGARDTVTARSAKAGSWTGSVEGLQFTTGERVSRMCDDIINSGTDVACFWKIDTSPSSPLLESVDKAGNEGIRAAILAANTRLGW